FSTLPMLRALTSATGFSFGDIILGQAVAPGSTAGCATGFFSRRGSIADIRNGTVPRAAGTAHRRGLHERVFQPVPALCYKRAAWEIISLHGAYDVTVKSECAVQPRRPTCHEA